MKTNGTNGHPHDYEVCTIQGTNARGEMDTVTVPASFRELMEQIKSPRWSGVIKEIRTAYARGGKDEAAEPKKKLPGILFSGTFSKRAAAALTKHSGLICADLDSLDDGVEGFKEHISQDRHVLAVFTSPTGAGLKVIFKCDPKRDHYDSYKAAEHYVKTTFGLNIDTSCKDVSRICFVSHDPHAFVADDAELLPYPDHTIELPRRELKHVDPTGELSPGDDYDLRGDWQQLLKNHGWTELREPYWTRPGATGRISGSWDVIPGRFWTWSPNGGLKPMHPYRPWALFAELECRGDFVEAARKLGQLGYGEQKKVRQLPPIKNDKPAQAVKVEVENWDEPAPVDRLDGKRVRLSLQPPEPITRLFLAGKPIATPGNLVTLISRAKTGKTAAIGAAVAAIIAAHHDRSDVDTFGFTAPHNREAVVLIDTEQSPYDAFTCHERALKRAGDATDPDWLCHYALVGESAEQLGKDLISITTKAKAIHGGIFTIIIDGIADFVESVNDEAECNNFISWLRSIAVEYNCPIICVIHSNEAIKSGDDGRGHLGKQLTRKAESNLLLKKVGEVTTITSEKQRKAPITDKDGIAFRWSDQFGRHVSCPPEKETTVKGGKPKKYYFSEFTSFIPNTAEKAMTVQALFRYAKDLSDIGETAFRALLNTAAKDGEVIRTPKNMGFVYHLSIPGQQ